MSIDHSAVIVYGIPVNNFDDGLDILLEGEYITEYEYEDASNDGELILYGLEFSCRPYDSYRGGAGMFGVEYTAKEIFSEHDRVVEDTKIIKQIFPEAEFCQYVMAH